jgi:rhodanese-related sulfurtransferase
MHSRAILSIVILALGTTAAMLPQRSNDSIMLNEEQLLQEMLRGSNYLSVDQLADLLINQDPSIRLIDVRDAQSFTKPIRGAMNIPVDSIFNDAYTAVFDQGVMKNVIYSTNDAEAVQVWTLMTQLGYKNNYLLKGGLTQWNKLILDPKRPASTASQEAFDLYDQRVAAKQFFTGAKPIKSEDMFKPILPIGGKKKKKVQGGCS